MSVLLSKAKNLCMCYYQMLKIHVCVTIKHLKFMSVLLLKAVNSWLNYYLMQVKFHVFYMSLFGSNLVVIKA